MASWRYCFSLCLLLTASPVFAQTARDHLNRAAETYKHLKSFQVEADVERGRADQRREIKLAITVYVAPPNRVRIETKDEGNILRSMLISTGRSIIEYSVWKKEFSSSAGQLSVSFDPDRGTGLGEMLYDTIAAGVGNASIRGQQTLAIGKDRIPCTVVNVEYGTAGRTQFSFWIAKSGLVFRRAVTFWDGTDIRTLVSSVRALTTNENLPEETFDFQPPPGVKEVPPPTGPAILAAR
jgi:outer membrane lipoprotein-sorting protein